MYGPKKGSVCWSQCLFLASKLTGSGCDLFQEMGVPYDYHFGMGNILRHARIIALSNKDINPNRDSTDNLYSF